VFSRIIKTLGDYLFYLFPYLSVLSRIIKTLGFRWKYFNRVSIPRLKATLIYKVPLHLQQNVGVSSSVFAFFKTLGFRFTMKATIKGFASPFPSNTGSSYLLSSPLFSIFSSRVPFYHESNHQGCQLPRFQTALHIFIPRYLRYQDCSSDEKVLKRQHGERLSAVFISTFICVI
jgi:hypothetical protein